MCALLDIVNVPNIQYLTPFFYAVNNVGCHPCLDDIMCHDVDLMLFDDR